MREDELDDELRSHLEFQARKHVAAGMTEAEAWRRARIEFGGFDVAKEQCRDADRWHRVHTIQRDLKQALRALARSPGFASLGIAILAVGIGATVGTFSVVDGMLLRPISVLRPKELIRIAAEGREGQLRQLPSTIVDPLAKTAWLGGVCGFNTDYEGAEANRTIVPVGILGFTGDCFRTLGIGIQLGRSIGAEDDRAGAAPVAVITAELWRSAYGGRSDVVGRRIQMPGAAYTIIGVAEDRFTGLLLGFPAGLIVPLHQEPSETGVVGQQVWWSVNVIGRRAAGVSEEQASAALAAQSKWLLDQSVPPRFNAARRRQYEATHLAAAPADKGVDYFLRNRFGRPLLAVLGICAAILAIGCVNLAGLMLVRVLRRRREIAVRLALGATPAHISAMLAVEGSLLVIAGAVLGIGVTLAVDRLILLQGSEMFGNFGMPLGFDSRVSTFYAASVLAILVALVAGSVIQARRLCRQGSLHDSSRGGSYRQGRAQKVLLGGQIALTMALVAGAGLFGTSLRAFYSLDLGVRTTHVWDAMLSAHPARYQNFQPGPYYRDLIQQVEAIPGITSAVLADFVPFYTGSSQEGVAAIEGGEPGVELVAHVAKVTDGFFPLMGMRVIEGRDFRRDGGEVGEPEAIVSLSLAQNLGGAAGLLGRHIRVGTSPKYQRLRVVGIASDAQFDLSDPAHVRPGTIYIDSWRYPDAQAAYPVLLLKTRGETLPAGRLRQVVDHAGREYVERIRSLDDEKDGALVENRVMAYLSGAFGILALLLSATGLFGLLSYQVTTRTAEIGIRMALGARRGQIQRQIAGQVTGMLAAGAAAGIVLAVIEGRAIATLLYGVHNAEPWMLASSVAVLAATGLIAAWIPARRAASLDPLRALRHE